MEKPKELLKAKPAEKSDRLMSELGELNPNEKAILDRMRGVKRTDKEDADWISVTVGQSAEIAGVRFRISHISKGFIILEADDAPTEEKEKEVVWTQLSCTGAKSLIRIDGTPFYVETRILSTAEGPEKDTGGEDV